MQVLVWLLIANIAIAGAVRIMQQEGGIDGVSIG